MVRIYLTYPNKEKMNWLKRFWGMIFWRTTKAKFLKYEDILLKMYMIIAETSAYRLLVTEGYATDKECEVAWEEIVRRNYEENKNFGYDDYTELLKAYGYLLAEYNQVKAGLALLMFMVDDKIIQFLASKGYRIETWSHAAYIDSIGTAMHVSSNLATKLQMKYNEISTQYGAEKSDRKITCEEMIAVLSYRLGFAVNENIKLSSYNEYTKVLKQVERQQRKGKLNDED